MYQKGQQAALEKYAVDWAGMGRNARNLFIGAPGAAGKLVHELQHGTTLKPGGSYADVPSWFIPHIDMKNKGQSAMSFVNPALTALSAYGAATAPPEYRGSSIGGMVGGTLGSALGTPFGMVGQTAGGMLGGTAGMMAGHLFDSKPSPQEF